MSSRSPATADCTLPEAPLRRERVRDASLHPIIDKLEAGERLSFEDGVVLFNPGSPVIPLGEPKVKSYGLLSIAPRLLRAELREAGTNRLLADIEVSS